MENPRPPLIATKDLFLLKNRTVLVTGGLGAVGTAITEAIMESGADVICFDLAEKPSALATRQFQDFEQRSGQKWSYHALDVTNSEQVKTEMGRAIEGLRNGYPLRGIVTAAGISGESPAEDYPEDKFKKIMDINVMGTFLVVQAAAKHILSQKTGGSIVLVASISGTVANKGVKTAAYNTSKSAILQLTRSLAQEWGNPDPENGNHLSPPIRVNSLSPGYIHTPMSNHSMGKEELQKLWLGDSMLGRFSWAEEYRAPVLFLLGDGSSYMTGGELRVDGGHCGW